MLTRWAPPNAVFGVPVVERVLRFFGYINETLRLGYRWRGRDGQIRATFDDVLACIQDERVMEVETPSGVLKMRLDIDEFLGLPRLWKEPTTESDLAVESDLA